MDETLILMMFMKWLVWLVKRKYYEQIFCSCYNKELYVPNNFQKYKIKHTSRINVLVVLKHKTNKELFKRSGLFLKILCLFYILKQFWNLILGGCFILCYIRLGTNAEVSYFLKCHCPENTNHNKKSWLL